MNARLSGEQNEKGATSMKKGHEQMLRIGSAGRRVMIVLAIAVCSSAALAQTQETSKAPSISDIRLMRKLGDHSRALEYVNALLADGSTPADVRKQAYNELVTMAFVAEGVAGAQSAAHKALMEFPDLKADPAHNPEEIQRIYDDLREKMFGRLHLASDPAGCTVSLKDREIGSTPLEGMYLPLGDHVLLLRRPNYADDTLHVDIAAGAELKRFVDMRLLRDSFKRRIGFEAGPSIVSMQYDRGAAGEFAGLGQVKNWKSAVRFGGGVMLQTYIHDRLTFQFGARYSSLGNTAEYQLTGVADPLTYDLRLNYVTLPVSWKVYPVERPRFFGCLGVEPAYLLSASLSGAGNGRSIDILERMQRLQVSVIAGAGCELGVGSHYLAISAYRIMGQMSLRKSTYYSDVDCKTREWRIALSFLL
jgi:hypothetical protein